MKIKDVIAKIKFKIKLKYIDWKLEPFWDDLFFPPSFYLTHTEEEIREIITNEIKEIKKVIKNQ